VRRCLNDDHCHSLSSPPPLTMLQALSSPPPTKDGTMDPITRNKVECCCCQISAAAKHRPSIFCSRVHLQLHATWSKEQWITHIKEAAAQERSHISQVIHAKKQRDDEYVSRPVLHCIFVTFWACTSPSWRA